MAKEEGYRDPTAYAPPGPVRGVSSEERPAGRKLYTVASSVAWIPITVHIFARLFPFFYPEGFSISPPYRLIWWLSFYLSLLCLMYIMIESFRQYLDTSGRVRH